MTDEPTGTELVPQERERNLALVPTTIDGTFRMAQALSMAGDMVPKAFQGKPEATFAAIAMGLEINMPPMQALRSIMVVNGHPTLWGDAIMALTRRAGHSLNCVIVGDKWPNMKAVATLRRGDTGEETIVEFSAQDAIDAKLADKNLWKLYPKRMLAARARTFARRDGAADALMGLYTSEEMAYTNPAESDGVTTIDPSALPADDDIETVEAEPVEEEQPVLRTPRKPRAAKPAPEAEQAPKARPDSENPDPTAEAAPEETGGDPDDDDGAFVVETGTEDGAPKQGDMW